MEKARLASLASPNQSKQSFEMRNQLGRRNLSPVDFKLALGRRYNRSKKSFVEAGAKGGASLGQNDLGLSTAAKLATQHGVSFTRRNIPTTPNALRINPDAMAGHVSNVMTYGGMARNLFDMANIICATSHGHCL